MPSCSSYGCVNRTYMKDTGVTFHKFPRHAPLRELWLKACRRTNWNPSKFAVLCSQHFAEQDIDRTSLMCVRLRENAVPSIFTAFPSENQPKVEKTGAPPIQRTCTLDHDYFQVEKTREPPIQQGALFKLLSSGRTKNATIVSEPMDESFSAVEETVSAVETTKKSSCPETYPLMFLQVVHSPPLENVSPEETLKLKLKESEDPVTRGALTSSVKNVSPEETLKRKLKECEDHVTCGASTSPEETVKRKLKECEDPVACGVSTTPLKIASPEETLKKKLQECEDPVTSSASTSPLKNVLPEETLTKKLETLKRKLKESEDPATCDTSTSPLKKNVSPQENLRQNPKRRNQKRQLKVCEDPVSRDASTSPLHFVPAERALQIKLKACEDMMTNYRRKIKVLQQNNRRYKKRIEKMTVLFDELKQNRRTETDDLEMLRKKGGLNHEFLTRELAKIKSDSLPKAYSPQLREFALNLYCHSPSAYEYVRDTFRTCLPHSRTISRWYQIKARLNQEYDGRELNQEYVDGEFNEESGDESNEESVDGELNEEYVDGELNEEYVDGELNEEYADGELNQESVDEELNE